MAAYRECIHRQRKRRESGKWAKQQMNRFLRRLGKKMLDDAPTKKPTYGYLT